MGNEHAGIRRLTVSALVRLVVVLSALAVLVVLSVGAPSAEGAGTAQATGTARSALAWTSASVKTSTDKPAGQCGDSDWHIGAKTGTLICVSGGAPEFARAEALARLGWSNRVKVDALGSQATAEVDVQGPNPATVPDTLPAGSTFKVDVLTTSVIEDDELALTVVVTLFKLPQPVTLSEALGPFTVLAEETLTLTETSVDLVLNQSADKDDVGLTLVASAAAASVGSVGGIAELPLGDSDAPSGDGGSSGGSTLPIAAAAGGVLIALAGGGLYVRRRLVR